MRKKFLLLLITALITALGYILIFSSWKPPTSTVLPPDLEGVIAGAPKSLHIYSNSFTNGSKIPTKYAYYECGGENVSPHIAIENTPIATKSVVLVVYDSDAPRGVFYHWVVYGLKGARVELPESSSSSAGVLQGINSYGLTGYGGPCPPAGDKPHRYIFLALALDIDSSNWGPGLNPSSALSKVKGRVLAYGYIFGTYSR
jgi:conserved hypothetical protein TIGR00481